MIFIDKGHSNRNALKITLTDPYKHTQDYI